jgi:hypothetical protein
MGKLKDQSLMLDDPQDVVNEAMYQDGASEMKMLILNYFDKTLTEERAAASTREFFLIEEGVSPVSQATDEVKNAYVDGFMDCLEYIQSLMPIYINRIKVG